MELRQLSPLGVSQMCWMIPGPSIWARVNVVFCLTRTEGEIFQPRPSSRAKSLPVPSTAMPPLPFSPVTFSGLIDRDRADERR